MITDMVKEQMIEQRNLLESAMQEQRNWEMKMLKEEHQFQKQQTETILQSFIKCIETLKQPESTVSSVNKPIKVVNVCVSKMLYIMIGAN